MVKQESATTENTSPVGGFRPAQASSAMVTPAPPAEVSVLQALVVGDARVTRVVDPLDHEADRSRMRERGNRDSVPW